MGWGSVWRVKLLVDPSAVLRAHVQDSATRRLWSGVVP